jgi:hypothetical protein
MVSGQFIILIAICISQVLFMKYINKKQRQNFRRNFNYADPKELEIPQLPPRNRYYNQPHEIRTTHYDIGKAENTESSQTYLDTAIPRSGSSNVNQSGKTKRKRSKKKCEKLLSIPLKYR